jgi:hypothetical protein
MNQLNLNELDISILKAIYDQAVAQAAQGYPSSGIPSQNISSKLVKEQQIIYDNFKESFDVLCWKQLITGDPTQICSITNYGIQVCIDTWDKEEYRKNIKKIVCGLINKKSSSIDEVNPLYKNLILSELRNKKLIEVVFLVGGGVQVQRIMLMKLV